MKPERGPEKSVWKTCQYCAQEMLVGKKREKCPLCGRKKLKLNEEEET